MPSLEEVRDWVDDGVDELGGSGVARVQAVFVDTGSGAPAYLAAKLGRFGKTVAIPLHDCAGVAGRVWVAHEREVVREAPSVDPGKPLAREHELEICAHFGVDADQGRAGEVAGRPEGSITARPDEGG